MTFSHRTLTLVVATVLSTFTGCLGRSGRGPTSASPAAAAVESSGAPIQLTLIGTNDIHGWVYPHAFTLPDGSGVEEGGVANFAGYLAIARAHNPGGVLLFDAGDLFQGTLASNLSEGAVVVDAYNRLDYQAAAIGNHEFDYGPEGPQSVALKADQDPFGALKARLAQAHFPVLAVNIYDAQTGARPGWLGNDGTAMIERKGVKVGVFGLVTPSTPTTTNPVNVSSLRFGSLAPEAANAAKQLREAGAQVVVAVVHAGGKCRSWSNPDDLTGCDTNSGEIFELLNNLPAHTVDAVIAGHTHAVLGHRVNGTPVIETTGLGRSFGTIDVFLESSSHQVLPELTRITPAIAICSRVDEKGSCAAPPEEHAPGTVWSSPRYLGQTVRPDAALTPVIAPALARVEVEQRRKLGIEVPAALRRDYEAESPLGSALADALREMENADVALLNSGGLRADLAAGELTYGALYEVLPFDNTVATLSVNAEELKRLLQAAYGARKGVFQVSGLKVKLDRCPGPARLRGYTLADGRPLLPERRYRVVLPDFLARGGDGLGPVLSTLAPARVDLGNGRTLNFRDALVASLQKRHEPLRVPKPGRITYVDDGEPCGGSTP